VDEIGRRSAHLRSGAFRLAYLKNDKRIVEACASVAEKIRMDRAAIPAPAAANQNSQRKRSGPLTCAMAVSPLWWPKWK